MGPRAIVLLVLIAFCAALFLGGLVAAIAGAARRRKRPFALGALLCALSACLILATAVYAGALGIRKAYTTARAYKEQTDQNVYEFLHGDAPGAIFTRVTGYEWPRNARVLASLNDDWLFDWESYVVFETDQQQVEAWLSSPPPFGGGKWIQGPVPRDALSCCGGPTWQSLNPETLGTSDRIWYAAYNQCCEEMPYDAGELMIVDPASNRVWVAAWGH